VYFSSFFIVLCVGTDSQSNDVIQKKINIRFQFGSEFKHKKINLNQTYFFTILESVIIEGEKSKSLHQQIFHPAKTLHKKITQKP